MAAHVLVGKFRVRQRPGNTTDQIAPHSTTRFREINRGYNSVFKPGRLSIGLVVPIEGYGTSPIPSLSRHVERVQLAEELGFSAVWIRDVPFNVPAFGDAGQIFDPFVYLGFLSGATSRIALGVASIILPLRHPAHVAKAAASADVLSDGRLILGVASGDRPAEYPALANSFDDRGERFRASFQYIRQMATEYPVLENEYGNASGDIDMLPKPESGCLPLLITGGSQQTAEWRARNGDGWMIYPSNVSAQARIVHEYRTAVKKAGEFDKPVMQPLYIDLVTNPDAMPQPIHLGIRTGVNYLASYLQLLEKRGVNHVALNVRFNQLDIEDTLHRLSEVVLPHFDH